MSDTMGIALVILGIVMFGAELLVPGGILGIIGAICILVGIVCVADTFVQGLVMSIIAIIVMIGIFIVATVIFCKKSKFVLKDEEKPEEGYVAPRIDKNLIGKSGYAETDLHPSGAARIDGQRISVQTMGDYINKGDYVKVIDVVGCTVKVIKED